MTKKLKVLEDIAQAFNEKNISWAVGGSLMLYFYNLTDYFNDIDIMIDEKDVQKTVKIMNLMAVKQENKKDEKYRTRHFIQYKMDDVDIDIMAGFVIVRDKKKYDCSFYKSQIQKNIKLGCTQIPLHSLKLWRRYYFLMGRDSKVKMIDEFLKNAR